METTCVFIIAMKDSDFKNAQKRYRNAGGLLKVVHVMGVKSAPELRNTECDWWCKMFGTNAVIGIDKAHRNAWQQALQMKVNAIIFEEDVQFKPNFNEQKILNLITQYDLVLVGNMLSGKTKHSMMDQFRHFVMTAKLIPQVIDGLYKPSLLFGTHAYAATCTMFEQFFQLCPQITRAIDLQISHRMITFKNIF